MHNIIQNHGGVVLGTGSMGSAIVSFAVATLPVVQWVAAFIAIMSGTLSLIWIIKSKK